MRAAGQKLLFLVKGCKEDYPKEGVVTAAIVRRDARPPPGSHLPPPPPQLSPFFHKLHPLWRKFTHPSRSQFAPHLSFQ